VLIYVESFENTYSDKNLFGKDLIEPLTSLKNSSDAFSFSSFTQMPGTGWTIAGIVASQCGVPLKSMTVFNPNQQGEQVSNFLSSAVCLGDVLSQNAYKNVYMRGASLKFAGADKFFSTHGYTELYGRENWLEKGYRPEHMNNWGLYDDDLFYEAEKKLTELIDSGERFNLTLLTVDAHHPSGYLSKTCARDGDKNFSGVLTCTARQVSNFIDLIEEKGWSDKVNVIVMGDHLAMRNKFYDKIRQNPQRTIFNLFISNGHSFDKSRENVTHFDMFPTILQFMGFDVSGGRLALGFSALKRDDNMTPPEDYYSVMINSLQGRSDFYNSLWLPATGELDEPENPPPYR
jgi:phosphoglycerol transferase